MITISRTTICTECTEARAHRLVAALQRRGYAAQYGEKSYFPPECKEFTPGTLFKEHYADALDDAYFKWERGNGTEAEAYFRSQGEL